MKGWKIGLIAGVVVILGGLFVLLRPDASLPAASPTHIKMDLMDGTVAVGENAYTVTQGDTIQLEVTSNAADELHLHGYDISVELEPGETVSREFTADVSGSFEAELHEAGKPVFVLEVQPE